MRKIVVFAVIGVLLAPICVSAEKMIFVTGGMSPPYVYQKDGQLLGMDLDVITEFCKSNGIEPEFKVFPWKRALLYVREGEAGGVFSLFRTKEREKFMYYPSQPINSVKTCVWTKKESTLKISGLDDLKDRIIGVIDGHKYGPEFDSYKGLKKALCKDKNTLIKLLDRGRADVILDSEACFLFMKKELKAQGKVQGEFKQIHVIRENPIFVGFSKKLGKKGADLAEKFSRFFKELEAKGAIKEIRDKYK